MEIQILAHRANIDGPDRGRENSLVATAQALAEGFGIETDLRRDGAGRYYIAHDLGAADAENAFEPFEELFRRHAHLCVAMNVKELGYEADLVDMQLAGAFGACSYLFDFELLEPATPGRAQREIRALPRGGEAVLASRLSDRNESLEQCIAIPAQVAWIDEFDSMWITRREIERLREAGRKIHAVSPDLHGYGEDVRLRRWADYKEWGVDGVCTDYALAARKFFAR